MTRSLDNLQPEAKAGVPLPPRSLTSQWGSGVLSPETPAPPPGGRFDEGGGAVAYWGPYRLDPVNDLAAEWTEGQAESDAGRASTPPRRPSCPSVSLEAEVPEALFDGMREFIRSHPQWDQYSVITSALAGFLFQNGARDACVRDHYLAGLFSEIGS
ncbi:MAG: DUF2811 domain-containing protein [Cyanobacteriota bacterium]